jgi:hypothetical protein
MNWDEIRIYLPKFLSVESEKDLFEGLKDFPANFETRFYSDSYSNKGIILQGDGLRNMPVINLPDVRIEPFNCMIFSNTCDISPDNPRFFQSQIVYAPIFSLDKYLHMLFKEGNRSNQKILSHIQAIREQKVTQIFYLPPKDGNIGESIVFFDRVLNIPFRSLHLESLDERRLFSLSNLGFYIFLFKLSIHFTRIRDHIDRNN